MNTAAFIKMVHKVLLSLQSKLLPYKQNLLSLLAMISIVLCFQNCEKVAFNPSETDLSSLSIQGSTLSSVTVTTKKNQPVTFAAGTVQGSIQGTTLSFGAKPGVSTFTSLTGTYKILDATTFSILYTPNQAFVGSDTANVYATDVYGNSIPGQVTVIVGNSLNVIQPALVVRGISCITCHSNVSSTIVTDYGYGNSWYFDTVSSDSFYFDRLGLNNGLDTLNLLNNSKIIVPTATVPAAIQSQFNVTTLSQFVQARFLQGSTNLASQVSEVTSLKINLPTTARIQAIFSNPAANQAYLPDTQLSPALSGLTYDSTNKIFVIKNLICDGDLYLGATVFFNNATVQSLNGCRIYSTGNIFIDTPIVSAAYNGSTNYNTQLMSSQSIWMGAGRINNGSFCEKASGQPTGWYAATADTGVDCTAAANQANPACDTLSFRLASMLARNTYATAYATPTALSAMLGTTGTVAKARASVEANLGHVLFDAACTTGGRNTNISRLMLVAPYVNNRYSGDFSGSTIAEAALMSLGTFTYQFDPVFTKVSIFSLLDEGELVSGEGL